MEGEEKRASLVPRDTDGSAPEGEGSGLGIERVEDPRRLCSHAGETPMEVEVDRTSEPDPAVPVVMDKTEAEAPEDLLRPVEVGLPDEKVDIVVGPLPARRRASGRWTAP
jgi:hypothetical protein